MTVTQEAARPTQVIVDGFEFNGIDDNGVRWRFDKLVGWHSGAGVDVVQEQRIVDHGQFGQPGHRRGKVLALSGRIEAADRALIQPALDSLNAVLADGGFGVLEYVDRTAGSRTTTVQLLVEPDVTWNGGPLALFQIQFLQTDPYKYGAVSTDSTGFSQTPEGAGLVFDLFEPSDSLSWGVAVDPGILTVTNPGTAEASVVFTVAGPTPAGGFHVVDLLTGSRITYLGGAVPSGSEVVLDGHDGTVVIDGVADRSGDTVVEAWPQVSPGGSRSFLFESVAGFSAAILTASCDATYW